MKILTWLLFLLVIVGSNMYSQTSQNVVWSNSVKALQNGNLMEGLELTNKFLKHHPAHKYAHYNKGVALFLLGDVRNACQSMATAQNLGYTKNKKYSEYYCNKDFKLKILKKNYYSSENLLKENGYRPTYTRKDTLRGALRKERTCFDVYYYDLNVKINPNKKSISGYNKILFDVKEGSQRIQLDLFSNMVIDSIVHNSESLTYTREFDAVWVNFKDNLIIGNKEELIVYYQGKPRKAPKPPWDGGFVWEKNGLFNHYVGVACEQLGASVWWPNKDHLTDRPDSMGINIEVPEKYQAISNGTLRGITDTELGFKQYNWFVQYPINNYNVTFYMANYAEFTDTIHTLDKELICRYHVLPENLDIAKEHFKQANEVVDFYNRTFGPFPYWDDNFRMVESPYEGMEHQTAIAYGNAYNNEKNSTMYLNKDYDYIIVHEAAHEWWGNSITVGDMADVWIHEGLATYSEYLFLEEKLGYENAVKELQHHMQLIFNFWPMVQNRDVNEDAFASGDVYIKGAAMMHSLRATVDNDSLFMAMLAGFYQSHKYSIVTTNDFIEFTNNFFDFDYTPFFSKFLYETDLPVLKYSYKRKDNGIVLKYQWNEVPDGFRMAFGIKGSDGQSKRLLASTEEQEVFLDNVEYFNFLNMSGDLTETAKNSFTYYWTEGDY